MLAIKSLIMGVDFEVVCSIYSISDRTLGRWVAAFNRQGVDGLVDDKRSGRPRLIGQEAIRELAEYVEQPQKAGYEHWTGTKFHGFVRDNLGHEVSYSTIVRLLHEQNYSLQVPQPWPDRQNERERQAFRGKLGQLLADTGIEVWFCDEMGVEGDPRPRRRWAKKGGKARVTKNGDHVRMNVTGVICPRTGEAYLLEFSHSDTEVFQAFLDEANKDLSLERPRQILICDNASWHKPKRLDWGRFEPLYLPSYSPDLNPIERLWLRVKSEWFSDFIAKNRDDLVARLDQALLWAIGRREQNQKTCAIKT